MPFNLGVFKYYLSCVVGEKEKPLSVIVKLFTGLRALFRDIYIHHTLGQSTLFQIVVHTNFKNDNSFIA